VRGTPWSSLEPSPHHSGSEKFFQVHSLSDYQFSKCRLENARQIETQNIILHWLFLSDMSE